jgi:hypothetical protein
MATLRSPPFAVTGRRQRGRPGAGEHEEFVAGRIEARGQPGCLLGHEPTKTARSRQLRASAERTTMSQIELSAAFPAYHDDRCDVPE